MTEPSFADVADKTVDHIANGVQQIADAVGRLAPGAWEIAVRYQVRSGLVDLTFGVIGALAAAHAFRRIWKLSANWQNDADRALTRWLSTIALIVWILVCMFCWIKTGIEHAINPEYFAAMHIAAAVLR